MSKNERVTDFFIGSLLEKVGINFTPNGSSIKEVQKALKTASKKVEFPQKTRQVA